MLDQKEQDEKNRRRPRLTENNTMPVRKTYLVTTFLNVGESSNALLRVKPLPGQGLPDDMRVECSRAMRRAHNIGTIFEITAKLTNREGNPFSWPPGTPPIMFFPKRKRKVL